MTEHQDTVTGLRFTITEPSTGVRINYRQCWNKC